MRYQFNTLLVLFSSLLFAFGNTAQAVQVFSNNTVWFRADAEVFENVAGTDEAENGDGVAFWNDQSVSSFDVTQNTAGKRPTYVATSSLNAMPALQFSNAGGAGGTDVLSRTANNVVPTGSDRTVLIAGLAEASGTGGTLFTFKTTGPIQTLSHMDLGPHYVYSDGVAVNQTITHAIGDVKIPFVTSFKGSVGVPLGVDLNGTVRITSGGNTTNDSGATGFSIGSRLEQPAGTYDWNGLISEVIVYDRRLNAAENNIAMNYLSSKYGTTLTASDLYAGDTVGNGHYDFEVFGVGQNAATASGSAAGNVLSGGAGQGLAFTAVGATVANGEYLLAGQLAGDNTLVDVEGLDDEAQEPMFGSRFSRVWYVDKTGALDATLAFDFEDSGLVAPTGSETYTLLYSSDGDFSNGWDFLGTTTLQTLGTVEFALTNAQLLDGYYTLAMVTVVPEPSTLVLLGLAGCCLASQRRRRRG